jgi:negative regulator of sigma-B (phosphoserine phosphatase)
MEAVAMSAKQIEWGVASTPLKGNVESGDTCLVRHFSGGALAAVIDGLGHGREAAEAAREAIATIEERPSESVIFLLQQCHQRLQGAPRSVVMTLASFNFEDHSLICAGVGNVDGLLMHADPRAVPRHEAVVPHRGLVGGRLPPLRASSHTVKPGDTLVLATDGIRQGFDTELRVDRVPQAIADAILRQYTLGIDDALVLVVRYLGAHDLGMKR